MNTQINVYKGWKSIFIDVLWGYMILTMFSVLIRYTKLDFLFRGDYDQIFYKETFYETIFCFYIIYSVNVFVLENPVCSLFIKTQTQVKRVYLVIFLIFLL
ncbi:MAG: hypothetical protein LBE13_05400 [Bacteroidales bacterium]|nr:hypothetical protein [Bacteroidales bacterium]